MKILDCIFCDGGYYINWDFNLKIVDVYILVMNEFFIDYLEVGYRNKLSKEYMGKFGYIFVFVLKYLRNIFIKKIVIMLNEKNMIFEDFNYLFLFIIGLVDMICIVIDF